MHAPPISCEVPFWARGPHAQTLAGHFLPSRAPELPWERLNMKLPDGDALRIRMVPGRTELVVHLYHGLGGSADADYMRRAAAMFWHQGHTVMAINHRGAGEGRGLAAKPYHMGSTSDMSAMIQAGRGFFPEHMHLAVGFSLSATVLLLLLGRDRQKGLTLPDRALAVNPVVDLDKASLRLTRGMNRLYDFRFVQLLRRQVRERWEFGLLPELPFLPMGMTLREFDEVFTARHAGFRDRDEYYAQCSCGSHLDQIRVPTVILSALDDPIASGHDFEGLALSSAVHLHLENQGGHMGYIGRGVPHFRWLDYALTHYSQQLAIASPPEDFSDSETMDLDSPSFFAFESVDSGGR